MKSYTGTKTLKAKPMTLGEYNKYRGWDIPSNEDPAKLGYLVEYPAGLDSKQNHKDHEGYLSWSPAGVFEATYNEAVPISITEEIEALADELYTKYCKSVGGVAFNGDPLPDWSEFSNDENKTKQSHAWKITAAHAIIFTATTSPKLQYSSGQYTFGDALEAIKAGRRVARAGWNGKSMWIALSGTELRPAKVAVEGLWSPHSRNEARSQGGTVEVLPSIIMKTADGKILMGWLASQTDMLSDDWVILED